ncbi:flagellar brake protein [Derxia lacustris]|uniref:flagellar brake protein n=1 Tax=Derxia lacustris TaxID=764842 RepID=UPI000A177F2E|nr:flagellar brake protein [Derxia lacustris]
MSQDALSWRADRYLITNPIEVLGWMRAIAERRVLCSMATPDGTSSFLSPLTRVDERNRTLLLDAPRDRSIERRLLGDREGVCDLILDNIRIAFDVRVRGTVEPGPTNPTVASRGLLLDVPPRLHRLQRRESFRVLVPPRLAPRLKIREFDADWRVRDLSVGGIGITLPNSTLLPENGHVFEDASLDLDGERFFMGLRVCHVTSGDPRALKPEWRMGLAFIKPSAGLEPAIARTVNEMARETGHVRGR